VIDECPYFAESVPEVPIRSPMQPAVLQAHAARGAGRTTARESASDGRRGRGGSVGAARAPA
jgi:hypothetical protein